jgi:dTDP-4-dehydrorhamnose reductase
MMGSTFQQAIIVGSGGMLARAFRERIERGESGLPTNVTFADRAQCDIADAASVGRAVSPGTDLVINCAAYTNVDLAETEEAPATRINGDGVRVLAARCAEVGATLVHFSTDYVFDGRATHPYPTDHPRDPLGAYGRSKAAGEAALEDSDCDWLCLRTSWLYAPWGTNFLRTIARYAKERESLKVVNDQRGRPTHCDSLARITEAMVTSGVRGMHHACDAGECTWFDFATAIAARVNPACRVDPCSTSEFPRPAPRPLYSVLDLSSTVAAIGPLPDWKTPLSHALDRLEHESP